MFCSKLKINAALGGLLAAAAPALALAGASYTNSGGEFAISGALKGDQLRPHVSISAAGGYAVWEDNLTSTNGQRIRAVALDSSLAPLGESFRVNTNSIGNQQTPKAALLPGGGAAFVWQGGWDGRESIYARFVTASNSWAGDDVLVSTGGATMQHQPAVAVLTNGNVVVVWGAFNRYSSTAMEDVYAQILSPSGQKIGTNFLVNQFTTYNQRNPAVTATPDGGFAVAWISEQQQRGLTVTNNASDPFAVNSSNQGGKRNYQVSVDVYGRLFNADGGGQTAEQLINTGLEICSGPAIAAGDDGSLVVAWAQKGLAFSAAAQTTNSWDVYARGFAAGSGLTNGGEVQMVNTFVTGDQYAPQLAAQGSNFLAVWTSLGQVRKNEGVFGRFLNADATAAGDEFQVNTTTSGRQMQPAVATDGAGRLAVVWASHFFTINTNNPEFGSGFDLKGQVYAASGYSGPAVASKYCKLVMTDADPAGTTSEPEPVVPALTSSNPYPGSLGNGLYYITNTVGTYSGLVASTNNIAPEASGYFTATVSKGSNFSAKLVLAGKTSSFSGRLASNGKAVCTVSRSGSAALKVGLQLTDAGLMVGSVSNMLSGGWVSDVVAFQQTYNSKTNLCRLAGSYTAALPEDPNTTNGPAGYGTLSAAITKLGVVSASGVLADGSKFTQSGVVSTNGYWPFYSPLYSGAGMGLSWVDLSAGVPAGSFFWVRPAGASKTVYPAGFTNVASLIGSVYAYSNKAPVLGLTNLLLTLDGAKLTNLAIQVSLNAKSKFSSSTNKLTLNLATATGQLTGKTTLGKSNYTFQAVVLQGKTNALGGFMNGPLGGSVTLAPANP
jgi:hypothetical protein